MNSESALSLRRATIDDLEFIFQLRNESSVRESSTNTAEVGFESHSRWYNQKINDPNTYLFIMTIDGKRIGQTRVDVQDNNGTISVATVKKHRGHGYGRLAIQNTCKLVFSEDQRVETIFAYIRLDNATSLKVFRKAGFSQEDVVKISNADFHKTIIRKTEFFSRELGGEGYVPPFPKVLRLEPASACNFKCVHCPTGLDMNPNVSVMPWETFLRIFETIKNYSFRVLVLYHGGEPLLNPNLIPMAKMLRPITERIEFNSNASILTDGVIDKILKADVVDRISFSIDGNSPEENDKIRVGANFSKLATNIKKLINARNSLGLKRPKIFIANTQIPETASPNKIQVPNFLEDVFKEIQSDISYKCTYALIWAGMSIRPGITEPDNNFCKHIFNTFTIRANGDVVPCCYDLTTEMLMGNVLEQSPEEIWQNKKYQGLRKSIAAFHPPKLCQGCEVLYPQAVMTKKDIKIV